MAANQIDLETSHDQMAAVAIAVVLAGVGAATPARAGVDSDRAAITERLQRWTVAFNACDAAGVCDVYAPDLVSTVPDALDGGRDALCGKLSAVLAKPGFTSITTALTSARSSFPGISP